MSYGSAPPKSAVAELDNIFAELGFTRVRLAHPPCAIAHREMTTVKSGVILPAIHRQRRSRDEAGVLGGEEHHASRDLLRFAEAIDRNLRQDVLVENVL